MKVIDTKFGQRIATCADSIGAVIAEERKILASIKPITLAIKRLLNQEFSQDVTEEIDYNFGKVEEFIAKWRQPRVQGRGIFYMQPNWAASIDRDAQSARELVADLAKGFAEGKFAPEKQTLKPNNTTLIVKSSAFVAMAIDPTDASLDDILDTIKSACEECGIHAKRIDEDQSNDRITDRIVDSIRTAEFVIVDLTLARPNVFFEAGFAHGLGKTPVYIAKQGTKPEFDIKDYPIIFFRNMKELKLRLNERLKGLLALHARE